jgi:hypothetical protein
MKKDYDILRIVEQTPSGSKEWEQKLYHRRNTNGQRATETETTDSPDGGLGNLER